jgi:uncharacterized protein (TIGR02145 family)
MKKFITLTLAALALLTMAASCSKDEPAADPEELLVSPETLNLSGMDGSYTLAITGNVAWRVTHTAEWLSVDPATGTANDTITLRVSKNISAAERTATITIAAENLSKTVPVTQRPLETPPYAVTTRTWVIGNQTWSDAIHIPECDKTEWETENYEPHCRSYLYRGEHLYFYYNWPYTQENAHILCPAPWRMPTSEDFIALDIALGGSGQMRMEEADWVANNYLTRWGGLQTGYAYGNQMFYDGQFAYYWTSTPDSDPNYSDYAFHFSFGISSGMGIVRPTISAYRSNGFPVRCIK